MYRDKSARRRQFTPTRVEGDVEFVNPVEQQQPQNAPSLVMQH